MSEEKPLVIPVENNSSAPVVLPATRSFPRGLVILPTELKMVETKYIDELCSRKVKMQDQDYNDIGERFPGKEEWDRLTTEVVLMYCVVENNIVPRRGTRLTVYAPDQAPREEGLDYPASLISYPAAAAKNIIASCTDTSRLSVWSKDRHKDSSVPALAKARLNQLKG